MGLVPQVEGFSSALYSSKMGSSDFIMGKAEKEKIFEEEDIR